MLNINKIKNSNKVEITFNTYEGVKKDIKEFNKLTVKKGNKYVPVFNCLEYEYKNGNKGFDYYLNTVLQLEPTFINSLEFPKLVFYDIETDKSANNIKNSHVNSIAWMGEDNKEYCVVKGVDGTEKEIIQLFIDYCEKNNIMGLVGHNSFDFDNQIMINRCKHYKINYSLFYNSCNLDTMILARFLQFTNTTMISLDNLGSLLGVEAGKTDTGVNNPITLYNEAIKEYKADNEDKMKLFREYNIQDVRLCKNCFGKMNVKEQLTELFKLSLCPFKKMHYNTVLLNHYTCRYLHDKNINVPESVNTPIKFKNEGGLNYCHESDELQVYKDVLVADVVSFYPHLLMLINADPYNPYENINRQTGEIKPFKKFNDVGLIGELTKILYESRARTKKEMNETQDRKLREQLNYEQKTKKIIVNSLYGALDSNRANYLLKNELLAATITAIGRDILQHIANKFGAVYAKTDSVFIPMKKDDKPDFLLKGINIEVSKFLKDKYSLDNSTVNGQLIRFEKDSVCDKLLLKDKNNYVKIVNCEYKYKGADFNSSELSDFEKDNIKLILDNISLLEADKTDKLREILIKSTKTTIQEHTDLKYFSKLKKLSEKEKQQRIIKDGVKYMENEEIPYTYGFKYLYCAVKDCEYNYIMYPKGYSPDMTINPVFVYDLLIKQMKKFKIINKKWEKKLKKKYNIKSLNTSKQIDKNVNSLDSYKSVVFDKNSSYNKLREVIGDKIEELTIIGVNIKVKNGNKEVTPLKSWKNITKTSMEELKDYKGCIAVVFKSENDYKYGFIDIDGFKKDLSEDKNKEFKKDLYNLLKSNKELYKHSVIQKTQSEGYHFIFKHEETDKINNTYLNGFKIPTELREKYNLKHKYFGSKNNSGAIEAFINETKLSIIYPSKIDNDRSYKIIHKGDKFGKPLKNVKEQLKKVFGNNDIVTNEYKSEKKSFKNKTVNINPELANKFIYDKETYNLLLETFEEGKGQHNELIRVYTAVLKYILSDDDTESYMSRIIEEADIDDYDEHIAQVKRWIENNDGTKPNIEKYLKDKELIKHLDTYLNPITRISERIKVKEDNNKLQSNMNEKDSKINKYQEVEGSFAEYTELIPFNVQEDGFLTVIQYEIEKLRNLIKDDKFTKLNFSLMEMINGGLYHYGLVKEDREIILDDKYELPEWCSKNNCGIYGFPALKDEIKELYEKEKLTKSLEGLNKIIDYILINPALNPYFYKPEIKSRFKQENKQLFNKHSPILNCAFVKIVKHKQIGNTTRNEVYSKYDFTILKYNSKKPKLLENYTVKDLLDYLDKHNLYLNNKYNVDTNIKTFINIVENNNHVKYKEVGYIEGFVVDSRNNSFKIVDNFPNLRSSCDINTAVQTINEIYVKVFNSNQNFIKTFNWFLIHIIRPVWLYFNIGDSILKNLIQYGDEGTGKTTSLQVATALFTSDITEIKGIGKEADTEASINRAYGNKTIPLVIDEIKNIKNLYNLLKKTTYTNYASAKAKDQYGGEINQFSVTRQIVINQNDIPPTEEGINRRNALIEYYEEDKFTDEQKEHIKNYWIRRNNKIKLLNVNKIGEEFKNFIENNTSWIEENIEEIARTEGFYLLQGFYTYINGISNVKLHEDFSNIELYEFDKLEINYRNLFYDRFTFQFTKNVRDVDLSVIDIEKIGEMLKNTPYINFKEKNNRKYLFIEWEGLNDFVRSKAGLNKGFTKDKFISLLKIKNNSFKQHRFKTEAGENYKMRGLLLTVPEFYKYFLNKEIEDE